MIRKHIVPATARREDSGLSLTPTLRRLVSLAVAAACSGDSGPVAVPPAASDAVATVVVTPSSASLVVGETVRLSATPRSVTGAVLSGRIATWQSSAPDIATVAANGTVTALAVGTAQMTAHTDGKAGSMSVVVQLPATVHSIQLDYPSASLALGQVLPLRASLFDSAGQRVIRSNLSWVAGDTNVVRVDGTGTVTARGSGQSHVTVSVDGASATSAVTVIAFASIKAGPNVTCALTTDGIAYCAGAITGSLATPVGGDLRFASLESDGQPTGGTWQICGLALDAKTYCWGANNAGQLGVGDLSNRSVPTVVAGGHAFVQVSVGRSHACGLTAAGDAHCWGGNAIDLDWGFNDRGALGVGDTLSRKVPTLVIGGHKFTQIQAGWGTTCALTAAGEAHCWGRNLLGAVGNGTSFGNSGDYADSPRRVAGGLLFRQVVTKGPRSCGLTLDGRAYCWGNNTVYELGTSQPVNVCDGGKPCSGSPVAVETSASFLSLSTTQFATCGITSDAETLCWGLNYQYLFGVTGDQRCPTSGAMFPCTAVPVTGPADLVSISGGVEHFCGISRSGIAYCWGGNTVGQRGWPGSTSEATPRPFSIAPGSLP